MGSIIRGPCHLMSKLGHYWKGVAARQYMRMTCLNWTCLDKQGCYVTLLVAKLSCTEGSKQVGTGNWDGDRWGWWQLSWLVGQLERWLQRGRDHLVGLHAIGWLIELNNLSEPVQIPVPPGKTAPSRLGACAVWERAPVLWHERVCVTEVAFANAPSFLLTFWILCYFYVDADFL